MDGVKKTTLAVGLDLSAELAEVVALCGVMFRTVRAATKMMGAPPGPVSDAAIFYIGDALENLEAVAAYLMEGDAAAAADDARIIAQTLRHASPTPPIEANWDPGLKVAIEERYAPYRAAFARLGFDLDAPARAAAALERIAERLSVPS